MGRWFSSLSRSRASGPILLQQVQALSDFVTVKYLIEKVVVLEDVKWYGENRVLMLAHGVVKAGVDLRQLKVQDLELQGKAALVHLPRPVITDVYLDDDKTKIIERTTGMLREFDKDLEQNARNIAIDDIRRAARNEGIFKEARLQAERQLRSLIKQFGFERVDFVVP